MLRMALYFYGLLPQNLKPQTWGRHWTNPSWQALLLIDWPVHTGFWICGCNMEVLGFWACCSLSLFSYKTGGAFINFLMNHISWTHFSTEKLLLTSLMLLNIISLVLLWWGWKLCSSFFGLWIGNFQMLSNEVRTVYFWLIYFRHQLIVLKWGLEVNTQITYIT